MIQLKPNDKCSVAGCGKPATMVAAGRSARLPIGVYCEEHGEEAADDNFPEYTTDCPNCGCRFGVN